MPRWWRGGLRARLFLAHLLVIAAGTATLFLVTLSTARGLHDRLMLALLAASVVRRLHDSDLSGWWALIPGAIHIANIILAPMLTRRILENMSRISEGDPAANMQAMQSIDLSEFTGQGYPVQIQTGASPSPLSGGPRRASR